MSGVVWLTFKLLIMAPWKHLAPLFSLNYFSVRKGYSWESNPAGGESGFVHNVQFSSTSKESDFSAVGQNFLCIPISSAWLSLPAVLLSPASSYIVLSHCCCLPVFCFV